MNETWNSSSFVVDKYVGIELNSVGRAQVLSKQGGTLYIALISTEDYNRSEPADDEYVTFLTSEDNKPHLDLDYTAAAEGGAGYAGTSMGIDGPAGAMGLEKANMANFLGVE